MELSLLEMEYKNEYYNIGIRELADLIEYKRRLVKKAQKFAHKGSE